MSAHIWHIPRLDDLPGENVPILLDVKGIPCLVKGYLGEDGFWHGRTSKRKIKSHLVMRWSVT